MEENKVEVKTKILPEEKKENRKNSWSWKQSKFPKSWAEVKKLGWKFVAGFILFYLIRDTILYIIIPYLIYKGVISF